MALTSSTTETQARAQLNNNLAWDGDAAKAADALEAIRWLILNVPKRKEADSGREHEYEGWVKLEAKLEKFVSRGASDTNAIRVADVSGVNR